MSLSLNYKCCELTEGLLSSTTILSYHCSITSCLLPPRPPFHIGHGLWSSVGLSLLPGECCPPLSSLASAGPFRGPVHSCRPHGCQLYTCARTPSVCSLMSPQSPTQVLTLRQPSLKGTESARTVSSAVPLFDLL